MRATIRALQHDACAVLAVAQLQILIAVVGGIPVDVMHRLSRQQESTEPSFHHNAVLQHVSAISRRSPSIWMVWNVDVDIDATNTTPGEVPMRLPALLYSMPTDERVRMAEEVSFLAVSHPLHNRSASATSALAQSGWDLFRFRHVTTSQQHAPAVRVTNEKSCRVPAISIRWDGLSATAFTDQRALCSDHLVTSLSLPRPGGYIYGQTRTL